MPDVVSDAPNSERGGGERSMSRRERDDGAAAPLLRELGGGVGQTGLSHRIGRHHDALQGRSPKCGPSNAGGGLVNGLAPLQSTALPPNADKPRPSTRSRERRRRRALPKLLRRHRHGKTRRWRRRSSAYRTGADPRDNKTLAGPTLQESDLLPQNAGSIRLLIRLLQPRP